MVAFYARLIAPFPYPRLANVQSSTLFGGMENAGAIFYSGEAIARGQLGEGTVAHEIAHQWFGDAVSPARWADVWLSEGFATYFGSLFMARDSAALTRAMQRTAQGYLKSKVTGLALVDTLAVPENNLMSLLNANSYQKGGFVLHMLRDVVGDSAFFRGVRTYYRAGRHGTAVTDDLQREMEAESGQDLRWFFDQWLRRPGYVEATTSWRHDGGAGKLVLTIEQSARFGAYRFPLTVALRAADGSEQRVRVEVPAERRAEIELPMAVAARPAAVVIDPDVKVLGVFTNR
jgi:aminopeptidase N